MAYIPDTAVEDSHEISQAAFRLYAFYCKYGGMNKNLVTVGLKAACEVLKMDYTYATRMRKELAQEGWIKTDGQLTWLLKGFEKVAKKATLDIAEPQEELLKKQVEVANLASESCENSKSHIKELTSLSNQPIEPAIDSFANAQESKRNRSPKRKFDPSEIDLPDCIAREDWQLWVTHRKEIKKPITEQSAKLSVKQLVDYCGRGQPPGEVIAQSVMRGWQGLFELKEDYKNGSNRKTYQTSSDRNREAIDGTIEFINELAADAGIDPRTGQSLQNQTF